MRIASTEAREIGQGEIPAGSYVIRMDQPYSRCADMLLDTQYYNVNDPAPYDDTGWTLGPLHNVKTVRVTGAAILKAPMTLLRRLTQAGRTVTGAATAVAYPINHNADNTLATFRFHFKKVKMSPQEGSRRRAGDFNAGPG